MFFAFDIFYSRYDQARFWKSARCSIEPGLQKLWPKKKQLSLIHSPPPPHLNIKKYMLLFFSFFGTRLSFFRL